MIRTRYSHLTDDELLAVVGQKCGSRSPLIAELAQRLHDREDFRLEMDEREVEYTSLMHDLDTATTLTEFLDEVEDPETPERNRAVMEGVARLVALDVAEPAPAGPTRCPVCEATT